MFSLSDERKRKINLGGASGSSTPTLILQQVQADRQARAEQKRRAEAAVRVQAWYRGVRESRRTKSEMCRAFEQDPLGLTGLRCLVLIGRDENVLGAWASKVLEGGQGQVFALASTSYATSWLILIRQASLLLLTSVAKFPQSSNTLIYLQVLNNLLSPQVAATVLGTDGVTVVQIVTNYLIQHGFYDLISQAVHGIPPKSKNSPSLPHLLNLALLPLSTSSPESPQHAESIAFVFRRFLTIPLLPNRLPLQILPQLVSALPLSNLEIIKPHLEGIIENTSVEDKIHLTANLHMFVSPHYKLLKGPAFETYLILCSALLNGIPSAIFDPPTSKDKKASKARDAFDEEDEEVRVAVVSSFENSIFNPPALPKVDDKTLKRLAGIVSSTHLTTLISSSQSKRGMLPHLVTYLFTLATTWTYSRSDILNVVLASSVNGGMVREIYRDLVRGSPFGKEDYVVGGRILDLGKVGEYYPALLFLSELYSQALLTMGDDEFFGSGATVGSSSLGAHASGSGQTRTGRNPLSLDELVSFSKQLLTVAFTLYWRDDGSAAWSGRYISKDVKCSWEEVREKVTRCLVGIHARDSRKPFVPPDHWLVTSQLDQNLSSFIEAAVVEEQGLSSSSSDAAPSVPTPNVPINPLTRWMAPLPGPRFVGGSSSNRGLTKRALAAISPRLGVLNNIPFAIPFQTRVTIFRSFVVNDVVVHHQVDYDPMSSRHFGGRGKARVQVRRGMVAQDGFDKLADVDLKRPVEITFIDQFGAEEAGIDGGGVFKEFFTSLVTEVFDTNRGLWLHNAQNELYPNPHSYATSRHSLNWYRFLGRILGKAMYEGILVDVAFAGFFLAKWLGRQSYLDDLKSLDKELYEGLVWLKHYKGEMEEVGLYFSVAVDEFGETKTIDLIPNGSNIAVTKENRLQYIALMANYKLNKQIKLQSDAFFEGLEEMIDGRWLRMFNQQELQILIGGVNAPISIPDLQAHTQYGGLYDAHHPTIRLFWQVVESLDQEQKRSLLRFVTSCSRPPLLGFKELRPMFSIRDAGEDQHRLPTSSTCVNLLKLPRYSTERSLRSKLLQAINSGAGFDLS